MSSGQWSVVSGQWSVVSEIITACNTVSNIILYFPVLIIDEKESLYPARGYKLWSLSHAFHKAGTCLINHFSLHDEKGTGCKLMLIRFFEFLILNSFLL
jgi:hypothetical protein